MARCPDRAAAGESDRVLLARVMRATGLDRLGLAGNLLGYELPKLRVKNRNRPQSIGRHFRSPTEHATNSANAALAAGLRRTRVSKIVGLLEQDESRRPLASGPAALCRQRYD